VEKAGQNSPWKSQERFPLFHSSGDDNLSLDDRDLFLENPTASVASLRRLITSIPESRSRSARNTDHLHRNPQQKLDAKETQAQGRSFSAEEMKEYSRKNRNKRLK
jgi:hypothetical protein